MKIEKGTLTTKQSLQGVTVSFLTRDFDEIENILAHKDKELKAEIKQIRGKRSLDANGYYWTLLGKLRSMIGLSVTEAHNLMLDRYGVVYEDQFVLLPEEINYLKEEIHYRPIPNKIVSKGGKKWRAYWIIKPSHLYDTKEFSVLLEGLISECREVGIQTDTPEEIERIKALWKSK